MVASGQSVRGAGTVTVVFADPIGSAALVPTEAALAGHADGATILIE